MKSFLALVSFLVATFMYAQEVSVSNEKVQFSKGTFDAIVVSIPFATKEDVLKSLKDEMKAWGGKVSESNDEFESVNAQMKKMGEQYFNGYSKVIKDGDVIKVAFIVDLGGAYMNKMEHGSQYDYIEQRAKDFGVSASKGSVKSTISDQGKALKSLNKEKKSLEKSVAKSKKNIDKLKAQIAEEEKNINDSEIAIKAKDKEIAEQEAIIRDTKSTLKKIQ
jgi:peptidoglycan hydrolase CwlO-like protein